MAASVAALRVGQLDAVRPRWEDIDSSIDETGIAHTPVNCQAQYNSGSTNIAGNRKDYQKTDADVCMRR